MADKDLATTSHCPDNPVITFFRSSQPIFTFSKIESECLGKRECGLGKDGKERNIHFHPHLMEQKKTLASLCLVHRCDWVSLGWQLRGVGLRGDHLFVEKTQECDKKVGYSCCLRDHVGRISRS